MLLRARELRGWTVHAVDGEIGRVGDLLFDDAKWAVRYLVLDTGGWLTGRRVLISPAAVEAVNPERSALRLNLSQQQVRDSPEMEATAPVTRADEAALTDYYGWPSYWAHPGLWGIEGVQGAAAPWGPPGLAAVAISPGGDMAAPPDAADVSAASRARGADTDDQELRSARDTAGYRISAADGEIGHVEDFLVDDHTWAVRYVVADTRNWWPGKRVLVPPQWITRASWIDREVDVDLTRAAVEGAPEWDPRTAVDRDYEERLHAHYGRPRYWEDSRLMDGPLARPRE